MVHVSFSLNAKPLPDTFLPLVPQSLSPYVGLIRAAVSLKLTSTAACGGNTIDFTTAVRPADKFNSYELQAATGPDNNCDGASRTAANSCESLWPLDIGSAVLPAAADSLSSTGQVATCGLSNRPLWNWCGVVYKDGLKN